MSEHYKRVPKDRRENLEYRLKARRRCAEDVSFRRAIHKACETDFLFWVNCFAWLYEPRMIDGKMVGNIPFTTWEHQDRLLKDIRSAIGQRDIGVKKSRGEGMSWMGVVLAVYDFLFLPGSKVGLVSRDEDTADDWNNSDSLGWKIDFTLERLPKWMIPCGVTRNKTQHTWVNLENGSTIAADAATGNVFRGGRLTWALMDEFAFFKPQEDSDALNASSHATNSRLFVSTVNGQNNEFYNVMEGQESNMLKLSMHWTENSSRNRGLYRMVNDVPVSVDADNPLPPEYANPTEEVLTIFSRLRRKGYDLKEGVRSPWYDRECDRAGQTPTKIAQELDMDFVGSKKLFFGHEFAEQMDGTTRQPILVGNFHEKTGWERSATGDCKLWCPLDIHNDPPHGKYAFGADIASGAGGAYTSNSVLVGVNMTTGEQVFEMAVNYIKPDPFARIMVEVAKWFHNAYLGWEHGGPGTQATRKIIEIGYGDLYHRRVQDKRSKAVQQAVGWVNNQNTKPILFESFREHVCSGRLIVRSEQLFKETKQYVYVNGKVEHSAALVTDDEAQKGAAHGDRVIAAGVVVQMMLERPMEQAAMEKSEIQSLEKAPPGSMGARMLEWELQKQAESGEWQGGNDSWNS